MGSCCSGQADSPGVPPKPAGPSRHVHLPSESSPNVNLDSEVPNHEPQSPPALSGHPGSSVPIPAPPVNAAMETPSQA